MFLKLKLKLKSNISQETQTECGEQEETKN